MRRRRPGLLSDPEDDDPMSGVANLFDTVMVFAVALLLARVVSYNVPELLQPEANVTIVKNPGAPNMQIIIKDVSHIQVLNMTEKIVSAAREQRWEQPTCLRAARWFTSRRTRPYARLKLSAILMFTHVAGPPNDHCG